MLIAKNHHQDRRDNSDSQCPCPDADEHFAEELRSLIAVRIEITEVIGIEVNEDILPRLNLRGQAAVRGFFNKLLLSHSVLIHRMIIPLALSVAVLRNVCHHSPGLG